MAAQDSDTSNVNPTNTMQNPNIDPTASIGRSAVGQDPTPNVASQPQTPSPYAVTTTVTPQPNESLPPLPAEPAQQNSQEPSIAPLTPSAGEDEAVTTAGGGGSKIKKIGIVFLVLLILLGIGYALWAIVLPRLRGIGGPQNVTLTWWGLWEESSIVEPLISEYQVANPHVTINYVKQAKEDYRERLTNALAQGTGPDIFRYHNSWVPMFSSQLAKLPESVYPKSEFSNTFYPVMTKDLLFEGAFVGIPLEYEGLALFVNDDIFANATKSVPETWDELRTTAQDLTIKDEAGIITQAGVALGLTENVDHWPEILALMMMQNGGNLANPTGVASEGAVNFYTLFAKGEEAVWDSAQPNSTVAFASGNLAMYFGPSWRVFEIQRINPNLNFRVVELPQIPKNSPDEPDITYASYWVEGVNSKSSAPEEAWKFLRFMSEKSSLEKFFQNAIAFRSFGEPYPRVDMRESLLSNEFLAAYIAQAGDAQSWYLASRTWDGPTGINSQLAGYYEDAINAINAGDSPANALSTAAIGINQVLVQYGLATPLPPVE